jgi:hypothetical protein
VTPSVNDSKILALVVCIDGIPRNPRIVPTFNQKSEIFDFSLVNAIEPKDIDPDYLTNLIDESTILMGRPVTSVEVAVMMSHRLCYEQIIKGNYKFGLILEDDVDISLLSFDPSTITSMLKSDDLRILTLAKSPWSSWIKTEQALIAKFPPPCASCYFINSNTANYALSTVPIGIADWPPWAHKVKFFHISDLSIRIDESHSYLERSRSRVIHATKKRLIIKKLPSNSNVKKIWQFRYLVSYRLIWKVSNSQWSISRMRLFKLSRKC